MANSNEPIDTSTNQTSDMVEAFKSGQLNLSVGGSPTTNEASTETEPSQEENTTEERFNPSEFLDSLGSDETGGEETAESETEELSASSDSEDSSEAEQASSSEDILEVTVTGTKGRKKVKIDPTDTDTLKKHVQLAYGARKWQKERDDARTELKSIQEEFSTLKDDWSKLESAYETKGVEGLVDLLEGREGAYSEYLNQEFERKQRLENMTDSEKREYQAAQEAKAREAENQRLREEYEEKLREINEKQEQADIKSLESKIHPSFDRYRFRGALGDEIAETEFDEMLWNRALSSLEKISDETELTQAIIDKEFRRVANTIKKHLSTQVDKRVKKTVSKQKKDATRKVQARVSKGMRTSQDVQAFKDNMKSGNFVDGLSSFFKAGGKLR